MVILRGKAGEEVVEEEEKEEGSPRNTWRRNLDAEKRRWDTPGHNLRGWPRVRMPEEPVWVTSAPVGSIAMMMMLVNSHLTAVNTHHF